MMRRSADIQGPYRYRLTRYWSDTDALNGPLYIIMLNPSTADAETDDPTVRTCINIAKRWGHSGIEVFNLFALRTPHPNDLYSHPDPIGPDNDKYLSGLPRALCAWGNHPLAIDRAAHAPLPRQRYVLGLSRAGRPYHPLALKYLGLDLPERAVPWPA